MKISICTLVVLFALSVTAFSINMPNIELGGGYAHISGNQGMDGFNLDAAALFSRRIALAFDYDNVFDTTTILITPETGQVVSKSHQQDFVVGPRIYFPGLIKSKNKEVSLLHFFGEAQFGVSHQALNFHSTTNVFPGSEPTDTSFAWLLGGGLDYRLSSHWVGRAKLDLLRTHFTNAGQSRLRLVIGVAYTLRSRRF